MSAARPSLEAQGQRFEAMNAAEAALYLRRQIAILVITARQLGYRIEVVNVPDGHAMGLHHEEIIVTPSREGYQSTT